MSIINKLIKKAIEELDKKDLRLYDSNIIRELRELSDGEIIDIINEKKDYGTYNNPKDLQM